MSIECMRILRKSDPNTYARLKEQYAKDFNGRDDIFDNDDDMADFIEDWHQNDSASNIPNNEKYLRKEALKCIYEGSQLTRLSASLLILNLQNRFGWSNVFVSALLKQFIVRGILAWTIHDFPGYGFCSGICTKGYKACPLCGDWLRSTHSKNLNKNIYLRHRRFLPEEHYLQNRRQAIHFNGKVEEGRCPIPNTPKDLYLKWTVGPAIDPESEIISGDDDDAVKVRDRGKRSLAQSPSIWYTLEYWKDLKICHLLDPMHIFKNVGHSLWQHLVGFKDKAAARNDLKNQNSKPNLWPLSDETGRETTYEPAPWVLTTEEVHLLIHLVDEIELAGVVFARWMFWAEKFMGVLKGYVRQKARPEGFMAEGWMLEECMYYVCEYLERTNFEAPRVWTNESSSTMSDEARMYTNMWASGQHLRIKAIDVMRLTQDSSIVASFKQLSRATSRDTNLVDSELGYVGTIVGIYEISYRIFKQVILKVDWFRAEYKGNSATMRREPSKFWSVDSSKLMHATREPYILVDHEEANQDELITSSNLDTSTLETCRISLADHDGIVDDENENHLYSDTTDTEEEEIVDVEHMEEMNVNTNLTTEEFEEVNKDNEDEILLTVNLR
ncbi:hypothetical protein L7F22_061993 [Adiantum nelumboides]|nr:hypothetical protein [Adiantum nelumboides]